MDTWLHKPKKINVIRLENKESLSGILLDLMKPLLTGFMNGEFLTAWIGIHWSHYLLQIIIHFTGKWMNRKTLSMDIDPAIDQKRKDIIKKKMKSFSKLPVARLHCGFVTHTKSWTVTTVVLMQQNSLGCTLPILGIVLLLACCMTNVCEYCWSVWKAFNI